MCARGGALQLDDGSMCPRCFLPKLQPHLCGTCSTVLYSVVSCYDAQACAGLPCAAVLSSAALLGHLPGWLFFIVEWCSAVQPLPRRRSKGPAAEGGLGGWYAESKHTCKCAVCCVLLLMVLLGAADLYIVYCSSAFSDYSPCAQPFVDHPPGMEGTPNTQHPTPPCQPPALRNTASVIARGCSTWLLHLVPGGCCAEACTWAHVLGQVHGQGWC